MTVIKKIYLASFLFFLLVILLIVFLIYPLFKEIKKNSEELILEKNKIIFLAKERENLKKMGEIFKTYKSDLEKIENLFIDPEVPIEFISFLEKISRDSGALIKISPTPLKKFEKDPWPSIIFLIDLKSSFPNFLKFLEKLESSIYLVEIQNLNISRLTEGDIKANFSIKVFTQ